MKTAVEWLIARFHYEGFIGTFCSEEQIKAKRDVMIEIINQAKEMEKEQHQETWDVAHEAGRFEGKGIAEENWFTFEEYWELTFKSE